MAATPFETFQRECPELAARFGDLVKAQQTMPGLDNKTRHLIVLAINAAHRSPMGVRTHAAMAKKAGATRQEVIAAVMLNLHLSGLAAALDALPAAIQGFDETPAQ